MESNIPELPHTEAGSGRLPRRIYERCLVVPDNYGHSTNRPTFMGSGSPCDATVPDAGSCNRGGPLPGRMGEVGRKEGTLKDIAWEED